MKLQLLLIGIISLLAVSEVASAQNKQLFEVLNKEISDKQVARKVTNVEPNKEAKNSSKHLFDDINFNQIKETAKAQKSESGMVSLFSALKNGSKDTAVKTEAKVQSEPLIKTDQKENSKAKISERNNKIVERRLNKDEKELKSLKSQFTVLMQKNENLLKKFKNQKKAKKNKKSKRSKIVNFIQKYDNDVKDLQQNVDNNKNVVQTEIVQNEEELEKLYSSTYNNYNSLQNELKTVDNKLSAIEDEQNHDMSKIKTNFATKRMSVKNNLNVGGVALVDKVTTNSIDLGSIKLDSNGITINDDSVKINANGASVDVKTIMKAMKNYSRLVEKCGEDLSLCNPISREAQEENKHREEIILDSLKSLRRQVSTILDNKYIHRNK